MIPFHPYADIFELIEGDDFDALVADVRKNGVRERIRIFDGKILDGRNRYCAALKASLLQPDDEPDDKPTLFEKFIPEIDGNPLDFVMSKNVHRRHLTASQRAYAMAEYEQFRHGGARRGVQDADLRVETRSELADKGHVSERLIASAATVRDHGVDELKYALKKGGIAATAAESIARLPEESQRQEVARMLPNGARAIMGSRVEPSDSLDYFPTPPWATRALVEHVIQRSWNLSSLRTQSAWEPACGEGHIAEVLTEYFGDVVATDIHGYGYGAVSDFLTDAPPFGFEADWIITNPPFAEKAEQFVVKAIERARIGVAMFLRLQWLETIGRYENIFQPFPPAVIAQFAERVPLCKGRWDPTGSTATAYLWIVWLRARKGPTEFFWIPPGCRDALSRPDDVERFTAHPVIKRPKPVDGAGIAIDHDPVTGECPDDGKPESEPPMTDDAGRESSALVNSNEEGKDDLSIPPFLRRKAPAEPAHG